MDWVHCNYCFFQPGQEPKRKFILTSCGHIFCQHCEIPGTVEACKMCGIKCTTTPLAANMTHEVQVYFEDPESVIEKITKVMEFQKCHRQRLNENYRKVVLKYQNLKLAYHKMEEEFKKTKNELEHYKNRQLNNGPILTPPANSMPHSFPLFSKNSQASKVIRNGGSQPIVPSPTLFATPTGPRYSSHQYRQKSTPMSDASSSSPASISSLKGNQLGRLSNSQRRNYPGFTPPINSLGMLSVSSQRSNIGTRH